MSDRDHSSRKLGLPIDKIKPTEVLIGMTNGTVLQCHIAVSGRLTDWFNSVEDFIVFRNAKVDGGERQEIVIVNKNQILWAKPDSEKAEDWPSDPGF